MKEILEQLLDVLDQKNGGGIIVWVGRPPTIHTHYLPKKEAAKEEPTSEDVNRDLVNRVFLYIRANPDHTRGEVSANTGIPIQEVRVIVAGLIAQALVEEVFLPKDPGQRGPAPKGLRLIP